jgi:hypothetical protein
MMCRDHSMLSRTEKVRTAIMDPNNQHKP